MTKDEYLVTAISAFNQWLGGSEVFNTVEVIVKDDYAAMNTVSMRHFSNKTLIRTCPKYLTILQDAYGDGDLDITITDVLSLLDDPALQIQGNGNVKILYPPELIDYHVEDGLTIRRLSSADALAFEHFHSTCTEEERDEGEVSLEDDVAVGCFDGEKLVSMASYWFWGDVLADIGILTDPAYRGKGIGRAVVGYLCKIGIEMGRINVYRHDNDNPASDKLSAALGFTTIARECHISTN